MNMVYGLRNLMRSASVIHGYCFSRNQSKKEQADNLKLKRGLWKENDKEIRAELDELSKVKDIHMPTTKRDRNYLKEMTLTNASLYQCKIIDYLKGSKSSLYKDNME